MEFINNPRNPNPGRPTNGTPQQPLGRRTFSDFGVRPAGPMRQPGQQPAAQPRPIAQPQSPARPQPEPQSSLAARHTAVPVTAHGTPATTHTPSPRPVTPHPPQHHTPAHPHTPAQQPGRTAPATSPSALKPVELPSVSHGEHGNHTGRDDKVHKPNHRNTHAGLVGFISFIIFAGLLLSPLLPAKILSNFPGSSQTESSGEQTLACATELDSAETSKTYTLKLGSPIVYKYTLVTTQKALCDGKAQSADIARSSQFNPLGLLANLLLATILSIGIAQLWRRFLAKAD